mgnify:CR=1 FL=1
MDFYQVLQERRSVRKYKPDPVSQDKLDRILDAARIAPSWKNLQGWKFIIVRDPEKKAALADSMPETNPARKAVGQTAPVVIVVCANPDESGKKDGKEYYLLDAGLAMQQLVLAAHAESLGTCWVAMFDEYKARDVLGVPDEYRLVAFTPLGVAEKHPSQRPRKELSEIVYNEEWGKKYNQ